MGRIVVMGGSFNPPMDRFIVLSLSSKCRLHLNINAVLQMIPISSTNNADEVTEYAAESK